MDEDLVAQLEQRDVMFTNSCNSIIRCAFDIAKTGDIKDDHAETLFNDDNLGSLNPANNVELFINQLRTFGDTNKCTEMVEIFCNFCLRLKRSNKFTGIASDWFKALKTELTESKLSSSNSVTEAKSSGDSGSSSEFKGVKVNTDPGSYSGKYGKCAEFLMTCDNIFERTQFSDNVKVTVLLNSFKGKALSYINTLIADGVKDYDAICTQLLSQFDETNKSNISKKFKDLKQRDREYVNDFWLRFWLMVFTLVKFNICPNPKEDPDAYASFISRELLEKLNDSIRPDVDFDIDTRGKDIHDMNVDDIKAIARAVERRNKSNISGEMNAFGRDSRGRGRLNGNRGGRNGRNNDRGNHGGRYQPARQKQPSNNGNCFFCGRPGHYIAHCKDRLSGNTPPCAAYTESCRRCNLQTWRPTGPLPRPSSQHTGYRQQPAANAPPPPPQLHQPQQQPQQSGPPVRSTPTVNNFEIKSGG
mmetsp:Transcript_31348/g.41462  ORF Transcript_31348/g.41462 Transcript_31348/m.41462 type:complete len:473 (-) Transcript_31348:1598-3016(-)